MFMDDPFSDDCDDPKVGFSQYDTSPCRTHSKTYKRDTNRAMPVAAKFFVEETTDKKPRHFLDSCALCMMPLRPNRDIYMYRGNVPFCSEECRQEQIEMDEVMEKSRKLSMKETSATIIAQKNSNVASPPKHQSLHVRAGAVVVG